jgi:hypothetical protein
MESKEALDGLKTPGLDAQQPFFSLNELHTKDAYLVFRALCKLGMKPLGVERCVASEFLIFCENTADLASITSVNAT